MDTRNDMAIKAAIEEALDRITDPGSGAKPLELRLVRDLTVKDGGVSLTFRPSSPVCPMAFTLGPAIKELIEQVPGVTGVAMRIENFRQANELMALLRDD